MSNSVLKVSLIICSLLLCLGSAPISKETVLTTKIPLKQAGRLFLIEATVDGQKGNFVFDTGATRLVLNKTYFRSYAVKPRSSSGITGSSQQSGETRVKELRIGDLILENLKADVTGLGQIENQRQVKILGLIGMEILKDFKLGIDLRSQSLELTSHQSDPENSDTNHPDDFVPDLICQVDMRNNIMFVNGEVNGQTMDFCLDTGAETNVICSSCRQNILTTVKINRKTSLTGIGGQSTEVLYGAMTDFSMGTHQIAPMQTIVTSLAALSAAYDFPVDGVLGFDFFVRGKIQINFEKKELAIKFY